MQESLDNPEFLELVRSKDWKQVKQRLAENPAWDISRLLHIVENDEMVILFRLLPRELAAEVFSELDIIDQEFLLNQMGKDKVRELLSTLDADDRTELFEELPSEVAQKLLDLLPLNQRKETLELLGYPRESVGRLMVPDYIAVRAEDRVEDVLLKIRKHGTDEQTLDTIYVVDRTGKLLYFLPLRKFLITDPSVQVDTIEDKKTVSIFAFEDQENAAKKMKDYNLIAIPVVDSRDTLLGVVTIDDAVDILEYEATEDFQKKSALIPLGINYTEAPYWMLYRKRIGWLILLLFANFFSGAVIEHYEAAVSKVVALAFFIPVLIDTGGNTATQVATLIIRAISLEEFSAKKWFDIVKKELLIGTLLGTTLGLLLFLRGYFWLGSGEIGAAVGISMLAIVFYSNFLGSILPLIIYKCKFDPAVVSGPLLTTLVDAIGLIIYFNLAILFLQI
jgi:magnesium transporter